MARTCLEGHILPPQPTVHAGEGWQWLQPGQGSAPLTEPGSTIVGGLGTSLVVDTMTWCVGGWGPHACSHPLSCWGLKQALGSLGEKEVRTWELEAPWVELEQEWSWTQEHHCCSTASLQLIQAWLIELNGQFEKLN